MPPSLPQPQMRNDGGTESLRRSRHVVPMGVENMGDGAVVLGVGLFGGRRPGCCLRGRTPRGEGNGPWAPADMGSAEKRVSDKGGHRHISLLLVCVLGPQRTAGPAH